MTTYILIFLASSLISAFSQILLKIAAKKKYDSWIFEYLNVRVISAYFVFFLATLLTVYCYKVVPLSIVKVITSSVMVFPSIAAGAYATVPRDS